MSDKEATLPTYEEVYYMIREQVCVVLQPFIPEIVETHVSVLPFEEAVTYCLQVVTPHIDLLTDGDNADEVLKIALSYTRTDMHEDITKTFKLLVLEEQWARLCQLIVVLFHMCKEIEEGEKK